MDIFGKPKYYNKEHFSLKTEDIKGAQPRKVNQGHHMRLIKGNNSYAFSGVLTSDLPGDVDRQKFEEFAEKFKKINPETLIPYDAVFDDKLHFGKKQYENNSKNKDSLDYFKQSYELQLEKAQLEKIVKNETLTGKLTETNRKGAVNSKIQDYNFSDPFKKPYDSTLTSPQSSVSPKIDFQKGPGQNYQAKPQGQNGNYNNYQENVATEESYTNNAGNNAYQQQQYQHQQLQYQQQQQQYQQQQQQYQQQQQQYQQQQQQQYQQQLQQQQQHQQQQQQAQLDADFQKNYEKFYRGYTPSVSGSQKQLFDLDREPRRQEKPPVDQNDLKYKKNADAFYGGGVLDEEDRFKINEQKFFGIRSRSNFKDEISDDSKIKAQQQQIFQMQQNLQQKQELLSQNQLNINPNSYPTVSNPFQPNYKPIGGFNPISGLPQPKVVAYQPVKMPDPNKSSQRLTNPQYYVPGPEYDPDFQKNKDKFFGVEGPSQRSNIFAGKSTLGGVF